MGDLGPCDNSVSETIGCRSRDCNPFLGHVFVDDDLLSSDRDEFVVADLLLENLLPDEYDPSDLALQEIVNLHIQDTLYSSVYNPKKLLFSSLPTTELNDFSKCAVLCSEILQSCPSKAAAEEELPTIEAGYNGTTFANNPDEAMQHHVCTKFVSALKGHRAQQGKPLNPNLHVTWATNVYDPPVTSSSHTVKGHRHRQPKAKKEHHKHKHKHAKAKPSHSSSGDKKRSHRSYIDPRMARSQALASRSLQHIGFGHSKLQIPDIAAAGSRESKCGASFHSESPWSLPLPAAEAS